MIWIIITFFVLIPAWLLLSPFECKIDTRVLTAMIRWVSIGKAMVVYEDEEWWLKIQVLFFKMDWPFIKIMAYNKKRKETARSIKKQKRGNMKLRKVLSLLKSFQLVEWKISIDTGDAVGNTWLFPLNFLPFTRRHIYVNFMEENYLVLTIRNAPWRMIYAWMK